MNCGGAENSWKYVIALSLWQWFEHWLGCTDKVKAGSTSGLIFNAVKWIIVSIHQKLKRKGNAMLFEKVNEVDEKLGEFGRATVDIEPDLDIKAAVSGAMKYDVIKALPGSLGVEIELSVKMNADPIGIALHFLGQSQSPAVKFIADQLAKLKAGQDLHPAVAQAAAEQAAAVQA